MPFGGFKKSGYGREKGYEGARHVYGDQNRCGASVKGESEQLGSRWTTQQRFRCTRDRRVGDLVIWDNAGMLHRALPYDASSQRTLHRTTVAGERAVVMTNNYDTGSTVRKAVLGEAYVNKAISEADDFTRPFQDLVTEYCWGAVWGREELPRKTRSMLTLAMVSVLNRPHELRTHVRAALTNGVTRDEIREIFMQVAVYAGVPAAVDSFRIAREMFAELDQGLDQG